MNTEVKNHEAERPAVSGMNKHDTTGKSSRERKQEQWEFHREEIHKLYMMENRTLRKTMQLLRDKYNFTPSERRFKDQLKSWEFEKNLPATEMGFIAAKERSRMAEKGKGTRFYNRGIKINPARIDSFKKRIDKPMDEMENAATPQHITYDTSSPEDDFDTLAAEQLQSEATAFNNAVRISHEVHNPDPIRSGVQSIEDARSLDRISHTPHAARNDCLSGSPEKHNEGSYPRRISSPYVPYVACDTPPQKSECSNDLLSVVSFHEEVSLIQSRSVDLPPPTTFEHEYEDNMARSEDLAASALRNKAEGLMESGRYAEAATEYLLLVDVLVQERGQACIEVFETLAELADSYQAQGKFRDAIEAYRRVVAGYKEIFGAASFETLRAMRSLGKVLEELGSYREAETHYRQAITGFEELGTSGLLDRLDCEGFLGDLLLDSGRDVEALQLLIPHLALYDELGLHHRAITILGTMVEIYNSLKNTHKFRATIQDLQTRLNERIDIDYRNFPEVLCEGIHLASIYCQLLEYERAECLLSWVVSKLELLDDSKYRVEKLYGYLEYGNINLRLNRLEKAESCLFLANATLESCNRHDDPVVAFVKSLVLEVDLRSDPSIVPDIIALSRGKVRELTTSTGDQSSLRDGDDKSKTSLEVATTADSSSCKYGITFSTTDITGISLSCFYSG